MSADGQSADQTHHQYSTRPPRCQASRVHCEYSWQARIMLAARLPGFLLTFYTECSIILLWMSEERR